MKKLWDIGFSYYPHESLVTSRWTVFGTEKEAKDYCLNELKSLPFKHQVETDFNAKTRTNVFCVEKDVIIL